MDISTTHKDMDYLINYVERTSNPGARAEFPPFKAGDTINVHVKIQEGSKVRIQQFQGVVIQQKGRKSGGGTFTVRKVYKEVGIERIFPFNSPNIDKIEVKSRGKVRRARLYYLREKKGKYARIQELR